MQQTRLNLNPLPSGDKIDQIIAVLQDYVINGNLKPGDEIPPERQLASQLGVSRFSMREALRVAQAQGLIEITRGRRPRVAKPSAAAAAEVIALTLRRSTKTLLDLVEARRGLECNIARLAALRANSSHIEAMQETISDLKNNKDNLDICIEKDLEFHNILVKASGNKVFEIMLTPLAELLKESRRETIRVNGLDKAIKNHQAILDAIKEKDSAKAADLMRSHLQMAEEDLKKSEGTKNE